MGRQLSPRHGHVILISISKFDQWTPCFDSCQFTTTYINYMYNIRLQASIQARESDNLHWFPCGTDGRANVRLNFDGG